MDLSETTIIETEETIRNIKKRSVAGVVAHTLRTVALQLIALVASLLLAVFLSPADFGIFFSVTALVNLFVFLSDVGLAASLIQKKAEPSREDLETVFTVQQGLSILIFLVLVILTPLWKAYLNLGQEGVILLYALGLSFPLASLKTVPSILLERALDFNKLVLPQIIENLVFYGVVVFLAWKGFGVTSYTYGILLRGVVGVLVLYALKPWRPGIQISKNSLKQLLGFGLPFQINDLLARVKDDLLIVVMKRLVTTAEIGYLGWAKRWSLTPFRFTVDSIVRVTFPAYSRLQHHPEHLRKAIEQSLFFISLIAFPLLLGMAGMAYPLTIVIPEYTKWQPALPVLYFFIADVCFSAMVVPLVNALNAIGHIKTTLKMMTAATIFIWVLSIPLVLNLGFVGVAIATAASSALSLFIIIPVKRKVGLSFLPHIAPQMMASLLMLGVLVLLQTFAGMSLYTFSGTAVVGAVVYILLSFMFSGNKIKTGIRFLITKQP